MLLPQKRFEKESKNGLKVVPFFFLTVALRARGSYDVRGRGKTTHVHGTIPGRFWDPGGECLHTPKEAGDQAPRSQNTQSVWAHLYGNGSKAGRY